MGVGVKAAKLIVLFRRVIPRKAQSTALCTCNPKDEVRTVATLVNAAISMS